MNHQGPACIPFYNLSVAGLWLYMAAGSAYALCPDKLPVALLEECIVAEGLGQEYPVEQALAEWKKRHGKTRDASATQSNIGTHGSPPLSSRRR